jgi:lipoprotein-anchoring transpeptidase ErfK/SrfK
MKKGKILLWTILILPYCGLLVIWLYHTREIAKIKNSSFIIVSKEDLTLSVYDYKGKVMSEFPVAVARNYGNKREKGDMKTPEGVFHIREIQNSSMWSHDFSDGKGEIEGAYGPLFIRLNTPGHFGIGIHGTHDNNSIGNRVTEGCVRLKNEDLLILKKMIKVGDVVVITPSKKDIVTE